MAALACAPGLQANIDPKNSDTAAKPQADFYEFASGGWIKANPVPSAYSSWGAFNEVDEHNKIALHQILENAAKAEHRTQIEQQVGDFYSSGMDETAIEAAGIKPLQPELDRLAKITCREALAQLKRNGTWEGSLNADGSCGTSADPGYWALGNRLNYDEALEQAAH